MARPFCAYAISLLKDSDKHLEAADQLLVAAQSWLHEHVAVSREQLADCCAPPAKRQRVTKARKATGSGSQDKENSDPSSDLTAIATTAVRRSTRVTRGQKAPPLALQTVIEEEDEEPQAEPAAAADIVQAPVLADPEEQEQLGNSGAAAAEERDTDAGDCIPMEGSTEEEASAPKRRGRPAKAGKKPKAPSAAASRKAAAAEAKAAAALAVQAEADAMVAAQSASPEADDRTTAAAEQQQSADEHGSLQSPASAAEPTAEGNTGAKGAQASLADSSTRCATRRTTRSTQPPESPTAAPVEATPAEGIRPRRTLRSRTAALDTPAAAPLSTAPGTRARGRTHATHSRSRQSVAATPAAQLTTPAGPAAATEQPASPACDPCVAPAASHSIEALGAAAVDVAPVFNTPAAPHPAQPATRPSTRASSRLRANRPAALSTPATAALHAMQSPSAAAKVAAAATASAEQRPAETAAVSPPAPPAVIPSEAQTETFGAAQVDLADDAPQRPSVEGCVELEQPLALEVGASLDSTTRESDVVFAAEELETPGDLPATSDEAMEDADAAADRPSSSPVVVDPSPATPAQEAVAADEAQAELAASVAAAEAATTAELVDARDAGAMALTATLPHAGTPPMAAMTAAAQLREAAKIALPATVPRRSSCKPPLSPSAFDSSGGDPETLDVVASMRRSQSRGRSSGISGAVLSAHSEDVSPATESSGSDDGPPAAQETAQGQEGGMMASLKSNVVSGFRSFLAPRPAPERAFAAPRKEPVKVAALQAAKLAKAREEEERVARQAKQQEIARRKEQAKARTAADALAKQQQREGEEKRRKAEARARQRQDEDNRRKADAQAQEDRKRKLEAQRAQSQKQQPDAKRQKPTICQQQQAGRQPLAPRAPLQQLNGSQPPPRQQTKAGGHSQQMQPAKGGGAPLQAAPSLPAGPGAPRPHAPAVLSQPPAVIAGQAAPTPQQVSAAAAQLQAAAAGVLPQRAATPAGPTAGTQPAATPVADAAPAAAGKKGMLAAATAYVMGAVRGTPPTTTAVATAATAVPQSYEISPYRSDNDESEEEEEVRAGGQKKVYPSWARRAALDAQLLAQLHVDPDEIFLHNKKTCALNEVFGHADPMRAKGGKDYSRRTSSGNWIEDRVTAKEQIIYKKAMGYL